MSKEETLSIALPESMTEIVRRAVADGRYASASDVVREALHDWQEKDETPDLSIEDLQVIWQEGLNSGRGRFGSIDDVLKEAKRRIAQRKVDAA